MSIATVFDIDPPKPPKAAERIPATLKPGWAVPEVTCSCGRTRVPEAYLDTDEWGVSLVCSDGSPDCGGPTDLEWPFVENVAHAADFRAAGFIVP